MEKKNSEVEKANLKESVNIQGEVAIISPLNKIKGKYLVKPCRRSWLYSGNSVHDGNTIFSGAQIWIVAERSRSNPDIIITGLSEEERICFEKEMFMKEGTLSPYNSSYWSKHQNAIKVPKEGLELDCDNNIKHKLFYKMLLVNSKVANSVEELAVNSVADVVITSQEQEAKVDSTKFVIKSKAYAKYSCLSQSDKINFLKVYEEGKFKVSKNTKPELIESAIGTIVDTSPDKFLSTFDTQFYKDFILLEDLLEANIILRKSGRYFINGGVELGLTKGEIVSKFQADDFQELKISLISKLELSK